MQQTGSEPPNRNPPELLVIHTSNIHTLFRYRRQHNVRMFSLIRTRSSRKAETGEDDGAEVLVPGATTTASTADPPRPPICRAGLTQQ